MVLPWQALLIGSHLSFSSTSSVFGWGTGPLKLVKRPWRKESVQLCRRTSENFYRVKNPIACPVRNGNRAEKWRHWDDSGLIIINPVTQSIQKCSLKVIYLYCTYHVSLPHTAADERLSKIESSTRSTFPHGLHYYAMNFKKNRQNDLSDVPTMLD